MLRWTCFGMMLRSKYVSKELLKKKKSWKYLLDSKEKCIDFVGQTPLTNKNFEALGVILRNWYWREAVLTIYAWELLWLGYLLYVSLSISFWKVNLQSKTFVEIKNSFS